jgi:hypothetical protein
MINIHVSSLGSISIATNKDGANFDLNVALTPKQQARIKNHLEAVMLAAGKEAVGALNLDSKGDGA